MLISILVTFSVKASRDTLYLTKEKLHKTIKLEDGNYLYATTLNSFDTPLSQIKIDDFKAVKDMLLKKITHKKIYCFMFTMKNITHNDKWILEQFDFHVGRLKVLDKTNKVVLGEAGYNTLFKQRIYKHKNPVFNLNLKQGQTNTFYIIAETNINAKHEFRVRTIEHFASYAITEYYLLGIYYGILLIMLIYYLLIYIPLRESLYLYFSLFILTVTLYSFSHDGVAFQFFWPESPLINTYSYYLSPLGFLIAYTLYTHKFIELRKHHKKAWKINLVAVGSYCIIYLIDLLFNSSNGPIYFLPVPIAFVYYSCLRSTRQKTIMTKYFLIGSTFIMVGTTLFMFNSLNLLPNNIITVYGINLGVVLDVLIMAIALSDRLSIIRKSKEKADLQLIEQLKENALVKDMVNRELEEKVSKRTSELNNKVGELDVLNRKLNEQAETINNMNALLDLDNHKLKKKVIQTTQSWISKREITFEEFEIMFPTKESCINFLAEAKWKNGYSCKKCNNKKYLKGNVFKARRCTKCGYNETPTAHTIFNRTKIPLQKAFYMTYKIYHSGGKVKASDLAQELHLNLSTCKYFKDRVKAIIPKIDTLSDDDFWRKIIITK